MLGPQCAVFRHVSASLAHEPDRRTIDRLTPAGFKESIIHESRILETQGQECQMQQRPADRLSITVDTGPGADRAIDEEQHRLFHFSIVHV